jgi:homoserine O-acetyltransferase
MSTGSVGIVKTHHFTFAEPPSEMKLESGQKLGPITLAYETYGELNKEKDNAILIFHALSGDAHAAGKHTAEDKKVGWWDSMIGPGKGFNTDKYFVICANVIGGCKGSTGPASVNPKTGKPYGTDFPVITIRDMVRSQKCLIDHLGVSQLLAVTGGSMGGMQSLEWAVCFPGTVRSVILFATAACQSPQNIALQEVGRKAIINDPNWHGGHYYGKGSPAHGLAVARMLGHISYLSDVSMGQKFGRRLQGKEKYSFDFSPEFQVESYLHHQGDAFTRRFDANSYLYITRAIDYFDMSDGGKTLADRFKDVHSKFLVISFSTDWLYPPYQSEEIVRALKANSIDVTYNNINSSFGHDAFLVDDKKLAPIVGTFLSHVVKKK